MPSRQHPTRQVHLDFHTSPDIPGIGSEFDKLQFQAALKAGNLESITVFAKCHHGYCYYPTKVGTVHPGMDPAFDFTGAMIDAAHEIGVRAPVYIPMGWSHMDAQEHPEWVAKKQDGSEQTTKNFKAITGPDDPMGYLSWQTLCLNEGPYLHHIYQLTEELCRRYSQLDGLFYDICFIGKTCFCDTCKAGMAKLGMDPESEEDAQEYYRQNRIAFMKKCAEILHKYHPDATIFFNGGASINRPEYHPYATHYEMEDLPTAWDGYDKFPIRAKCFQRYGKPYVGMTGKFHLDWGEFGGFKTPGALKYEIATMAMYGAGASVGDDMHPDGQMEMQTYETIGEAFRYLEAIAPYSYDAEPVANLGLLIGPDHATNEGVSRMLLENQMDYGIVHGNNFDQFDTVIIPENVTLAEDGVAALQKYLAEGGKLLLMGNALVRDGAFQIDTGLAYLGEPEFDCDYIVSLEKQPELPNAPLLCYTGGHRTECADAEELAQLLPPYFSRTFRHFCGHKNTPQDKAAQRYPAIAQKGNVLYMAHNLPAQYYAKGALYHKYYFLNALNRLHDHCVQVQGLGSQGRCAVLHQQQHRRYCAHMTYASPVKRGAAEIIEDILPVYNIAFTMSTEKAIKKVTVALTGQELPFHQEDGTLSFTLPELNCHTVVTVEY